MFSSQTSTSVQSQTIPYVGEDLFFEKFLVLWSQNEGGNECEFRNDSISFPFEFQLSSDVQPSLKCN